MSDIFAKRLIILRRRKRISQQDLAEALDVTRGCITNWERGEREPRRKLIDKLASYFEVSVDYLLGIEKETNEKLMLDGLIEQKTLDISILDAKSKMAICSYYQYLREQGKTSRY